MLRQSLYMIYLIYMLIEEEETSMGLAVWVFQIYINENIDETRRLNKKLIHLIDPFDHYSHSLNIHFLPWPDLIQLPFCSIKMPRKKAPKLFHVALRFSFLINEKQLKVLSSMLSHVSCALLPELLAFVNHNLWLKYMFIKYLEGLKLLKITAMKRNWI